ncbi:LuxR C-terminal-related transcriptional regulator [Falsibacillus pallidus]|uniref:LuxR C-terminal-related transcriptional regulator n=1 Tax=Falsibacillus pallidus TaxID=493781 RepID=UPI003D997D93
METKIKNLFQRAIELLLSYENEFFLEWGNWKKTLMNRGFRLIPEFDQMLRSGFSIAKSTTEFSIDQFAFAMAAEWNKKYPLLKDDTEGIFIITMIEDRFHHLLSKEKKELLDHQAVQAFFSRMIDQVLLTSQNEIQSDHWLRLMTSTKMLPLQWMAIVHENQAEYKVHKISCPENHPITQQMIGISEKLRADSLADLSLALEKLLSTETSGGQLIQIPCLHDHVLLMVPDGEIVTKEKKEWFRRMYVRQLTVSHLQSELEWKDAALLYLQRLLHSRNVEEAIESVSQGLVDYLPFKRCGLCLYSPSEDKGIGSLYYNVDSQGVSKTKGEIHRDPLLKEYFEKYANAKPIFCNEPSNLLPDEYVKEYHLKSFVAVPLYAPLHSKLIGVALLDQGAGRDFTISTQTLATLIKFGRYAGDLLHPYWNEASNHLCLAHNLLSPREKEVLKHISNGASISETADALSLSSYTVRDYVSIIIQKMDAKNRTEAAVKAIKLKII